MDSELQRLRFRVRQLEREVRALRSAALDEDDAEVRGAAAPASSEPFGRRRVLNPWPARGHELPVARDAGGGGDVSGPIPTTS